MSDKDGIKLNEHIYNLMETAQNSGMNIVDFLRSNFSPDELDALQTKVNSELKAREPVISGFRETYTRTSDVLDVSTMSSDELDALQSDVARGLAEKREELAMIRGEDMSPVMHCDVLEELAVA